MTLGRFQLMPMMEELRVLDKKRGVVRLGDVMKDAQIQLITEVERQINENGRVRVIVLKARQMGISTVIEGIIFCLSILFQDFQSLVISHEKESSEHILTMTKRYWDTYPFKRFHTEKYAGRKQLSWADTRSNITIGTARNAGTGRSRTLHAVHASEVAKWDRSPEELMTGLLPSIPGFGLTCIFYESTANGIGNFFHNTWVQAEERDSEFIPMFFPWWEEPEYTSAYLPPDQKAKFSELSVLDDEEKKLRSMGISDQRLLWRRWAIVNLAHGDVDEFKQEYPATAHEAFLATGRNVFKLDNLLAHYLPMTPDVGKLRRAGNKVEFVKDSRGPLKVYRHPSPDRNWGVYQIGADPTHTTVGDMACAQVINRRTLEQAATYSGHLDTREFGKQLILLGEYYNTAQIAAEKQGPGYATIGVLTEAGYPNIYTTDTNRVDKQPGIPGDVMGWSTNAQTKPMAISHVVARLAERLVQVGNTQYGLILHDEETYREMRDYVINDRGGYQNGNGSKFDDCVMALCIAVASHQHEPPVRPYQPDASANERIRQIRAVDKNLAKAGATVIEDEHGDTAISTADPHWRVWGEDE